ncbi:MAG TPA: preprotein translocase subunit SecA [Planctomycetota bacterium]|jgi:preprotein translocase subunit SecA
MIDEITEFVGNAIGTIFPSRSASVLKKLAPRIELVNALEKDIARLTDEGLKDKTKAFRAEIAKIRAKNRADVDLDIEQYLDSILPEAFALVREAGKRALGMRHFDVQLIGGMVLHGAASPIKSNRQNRGMISEMVTGEGKTLVATLPSYLNALPRREDEYAYVHVVTTNDYLAKRDADWNRPLFELLGMSCAAIQSQMDSWERHPVYACDIVYGTNSEFGFDYLRDNMKMEAEKQVQKVRHFAIVDEVDSILIDEARTPLIISGAPDQELGERYRQAAEVVAAMNAVPEEEKIRVEEQRLHGNFEEPTVGHYIVDEKDHTVTLTAEGMHECERLLKGKGILAENENVYAGKHMDWPHFIDNALKAKELYKKDKEYVVAQGREGKLEVLIVDEFTGHMMYGRRWSDGLHQAVEAKEIMAGEKIQPEAETHTLATITIQNFFKLYKKLAGMTGTAVTESREFGQIYKLEVCSIPTNRPMRRVNHPDVIYGTEREKWEAICQEIEDVHASGRPILVGTTSVEKSELLAGMLDRRGLKGKFEVLNAKQHAREAPIVAKAGHLGSITVATNMAGRGVDIMLRRFTINDLIAHWQDCKYDGAPLAPKDFDTNRSIEEMEKHLIGYWLKIYDKKVFDETPEEKRWEALEKVWRTKGRNESLRLAESVKELGGLHIVGSERHEARRIDNQLRGRAGRQGDPGSSRFFLCLDDDLMRIFARDWVRNFLRYSGMKDGIPLESRMVSRSIEKAQRRVEEHHFGTRKRLLEYDQVMNEQRKLIYSLRQSVLESKGLKETMLGWIEDVIALNVQRECVEEPAPPEAIRNLVNWAKRKFLVEIVPQELTNKTSEEIEDLMIDRVQQSYDATEKTLGNRDLLREIGAFSYTPAELDLQDGDQMEQIEKKIEAKLKLPPNHTFKARGSVDAEGKLTEISGIVAEKLPTVRMRIRERKVLLNLIDKKWMNHLHDMDTLREGIYLRGFAQKDPKLEYKREGFALFEEMFNQMKEQASDLILKMPAKEDELESTEVASIWNEDQAQTIHEEAGSAFAAKPQAAAETSGTSAMAAQSEHGGTQLKPVETIRKDQNKRVPAPNEPCPCGSGRKYKKCHPGMGVDEIEAMMRARGRPFPAPKDKPTVRPKEHKGEVKMGG